MSMVLGPPSRKRKMHVFALPGVLVAAVACHWNRRGKLSPASSPEAPSRNACRRVTPPRPRGIRMSRPPLNPTRQQARTWASPAHRANARRALSVIVDELLGVQQRPQHVLDGGAPIDALFPER